MSGNQKWPLWISCWQKLNLLCIFSGPTSSSSSSNTVWAWLEGGGFVEKTQFAWSKCLQTSDVSEFPLHHISANK